MSTRKRSDEDFEREIREHIELEREQLTEEGVPPDEARRAALRRFGNVTLAKERFYEVRRAQFLDSLARDLRGAARNLRRYPVASLVAVLSLAAGLGATTVTLQVRDVVFYKPPPTYADPAQISRIQVGQPDRPIMPLGSGVPPRLFEIWNDSLGVPIAGSDGPRGVRDIRARDRTDTAPVRGATTGFFDLLGVKPHLGRTFSRDTPSDTTFTPAVLSYRHWQQIFDERQDAVGQVLWIDNEPHTVIGVLPPRFWFSDMSASIWTPIEPRTLSSDVRLEVVVRRPRDMTPWLLDARLQAGLAEYARQLPADQRELRTKVSGIEGTPVGRQVAFVLPYVLGTSVLLTLMIACANVAILMIAQWTAREHEIAIRASIGGSRSRIVRTLLTESVLIAVIGGVLGIGATFVLRSWIAHRAGIDVELFDLTIDPDILLNSAAIAFFAGIVTGIAPALYETRRLHTNPLRAIASSDRVRQRWRNALVVLEVTLTVALVVQTTTMIDSYQRARTAHMGFSSGPLLGARVERDGGVPAGHVLDTVSQLPGVATAAVSTMVPFMSVGSQERVAADAAGSNAVMAERGAISAGFFTALGVPMRAGRPFSVADTPATHTAIVNEALAHRLFPTGAAVGSRIWVSGAPYEVVGIVADYSNNPIERRAADPKLFLPLAESADMRRLFVVVRADSDPAPLVPAIRREIRAAAAGLAVSQAFTFDQIVRVIGQEMLLGTAPLFPLIAIGMLLTTAGIYGVLAFAITRRSRELAVRVAMGATGRDLMRLVSSQSARLVSAGLALGLALMLALSRIIKASGGAGSFIDPEPYVFLVPIAVVVLIGVIATWIPSRRARKVDPATLLRTT